MTTEKKIEINKKIKKYEGTNGFLISLQKQLKSNKYLNKEEHGKKQVKVLSEKQYLAALVALL
jgi:hypothetical protein